MGVHKGRNHAFVFKVGARPVSVLGGNAISGINDPAALFDQDLVDGIVGLAGNRMGIDIDFHLNFLTVDHFCLKWVSQFEARVKLAGQSLQADPILGEI
jgi:hypothetical protein